MDDVNRVVVEILPSTDLGGAEVALLARLRTLNRLGLLPRTLVVDLGSEPGRLAPDLGRYAPVFSAPPTGAVRWIRHLLVSMEADLVVCHSPRSAILTWLATRSLSSRTPYVVVAHSTILSESQLKAVILAIPLRFANRRARRVLAVSSAAARGPWARGSRDIQVAILGSQLIADEEVDAETLWPRKTRVRMLAMSRFTETKNYSALIDAIAIVQAELREAKAAFAVVGYGPTEDALKSQVDRNCIQDLVRIHPATDSPGAFMQHADVFLIPSSAEGGPLTLYEALLAGCRVITTNVGVAPDVVYGSDDTGLTIINRPDPHSLSDALIHMARQGPVPRYEREQRAQKFAYLDSSECALDTQRLIMFAASESRR